MTALEAVLAVVTIFSTNYGTILLKDYLDKVKEKRNRQNNNMDADYYREMRVKPILSGIRHKLQASRVAECSFSNGDTTFGGYHMKKVSITVEDNAEGFHDIAPIFQLVPAANFKRTLDGLHFSEDGCEVSYEHEHNDDLAILNMSHGINTLVLVKVRDRFDKWIGYVLVGFKERNVILSREQLVFLKTEVSKLQY